MVGSTGGSSGLGVCRGRAGSPWGKTQRGDAVSATATPHPPPPHPRIHRVPKATRRDLTDALKAGGRPDGFGVVEDALDEAGGAGFALVARLAGVAQAGVELRAVARIDVRVVHGLGAAASHCHGGGKIKIKVITGA